MKNIATIICVLCAVISVACTVLTLSVGLGTPADARPGAAAVDELARAADETRWSSVVANIKTVRSQLQLYKAQHDERWPSDFGRQMSSYTDLEGRTSERQTEQCRFGPYLLRVPNNPYTGMRSVAVVAGAAESYRPAEDMDGGWWYNSATGEFRCHVPDSVVTPEGKKVNEL